MSSSVGSGLASTSALAAITMPGVQKPHWMAPFAMNAFCSGCIAPSDASPSMVVTSWPSAATASTRHDLTASPSRSTVQVPQSPKSQPLLVPVSPRCSRNRSRRVTLGRTATLWASPLTVRWTALHRISITQAFRVFVSDSESPNPKVPNSSHPPRCWMLHTREGLLAMEIENPSQLKTKNSTFNSLTRPTLCPPPPVVSTRRVSTLTSSSRYSLLALRSSIGIAASARPLGRPRAGSHLRELLARHGLARGGRQDRGRRHRTQGHRRLPAHRLLPSPQPPPPRPWAATARPARPGGGWRRRCPTHRTRGTSIATTTSAGSSTVSRGPTKNFAERNGTLPRRRDHPHGGAVGEQDRRHVGRRHRHAQIAGDRRLVAHLLGGERHRGVVDARKPLRLMPS